MKDSTTATASRVSREETARSNHNFVFGSWLLPNIAAWAVAVVMWGLMASSSTGEVLGFTSGSLFAAVSLFSVISVLIPVFVSALTPDPALNVDEEEV